MKKLQFALIVLVVALSACQIAPLGAVTGSGRIVTQELEVRDFDHIRLGTSGTLYIEQGDDFTLVVEADDNILPLLQIVVDQDVLVLRTEASVRRLQAETLIYRVTLPALSALDVSSSGDVRMQSLEGESLQIVVSGSGDVTFDKVALRSLSVKINGSGSLTVHDLSAETVFSDISGSGLVNLAGKAETHEVNISGSGDVQTAELRTANTRAAANGSGDAFVWALNALDVNITNSGNVAYYGTPAVTEKISGSGELTPLGEK